MEYYLRNCSYDDVEFIVELKRLGLKWYIEDLYGWDEEIQKCKTIEELEANPNATKIIVVDNKDVGVTAFQKNEEHYTIGLTLIHPDYQNRKIATTILSNYIEIAKKDKKRIIIKTFKENRAKNLYERLGFTVYKRDNTHIYLEIDFSEK